MRVLRPVIESKSSSLLRTHWAFLAAAFLYLLSASDASATATTDFSTYAAATANKTNVLVDIFVYVCFIMGAVLAGLGVNEMRRVVDGTGGGGLGWKQPLAKLGFGGLFLTLPYATKVVQATMSDGAGGLNFTKLNVFRFGALVVDDASISGMISKGIYNAGVLINVAALAAFIMGVFFTIRGLQMLKAHIENPGNAPLPEGLKRLVVGGLLFSLPMLARVVRSTFGAIGSTGLDNSGWSSTTTPAAGLDGMMVRLVKDIANPAFFAIEIFCFIAGILMIFFAVQRLVRTAQDGPRGPLGFGTITMFFVAGALLSFPQLLGMLNMSLFGTGTATTTVSFMSLAASDPIMDQNAKNVFSAVLAFMAVVGFLSVVRGLFMLKTLADGGQATMMQIVVHMVAGALAINLGSLINAVQTTLGLTSFPVTFT